MFSLAIVTFLVAPFALAAGHQAPATRIVPSCDGVTATNWGTSGNDVIMGTAGDDVLVGLGGNDVINGKSGDDLICGGSGDDNIVGGGGNDLIFGNSGNDVLRGGKGWDAINGGAGDDTLRGGPKRDVLDGGSGNDDLIGGRGEDLLRGGAGSGDTATGGLGRDDCRTAETEIACDGYKRPFRLLADGVTGVPFGTATDTALVELALLGDPLVEGDPDEDTGWIDSFSQFGTCPGTEVRVVRWGDFQAFFTRNAISEEGTFFTWEIVDPLDDRDDTGLRSVKGAQWPDTRGQLRLIFGSAVTFDFIDPFGFWAFYVDGNPSGLRGTLANPGSSVGDPMFLYGGGTGCGE